MKDLMLDLETMGIGHNAAIIQIGAVYFDRETGEIGNSFFKTITLESAMKAGLLLDASTIMWWMKQSEEARKRIVGDTAIKDVFEQFTIFVKKDTVLWCHAGFDAPLLANAFNKLDMDFPINYYNVRDLRTLVDMADIDPRADEFKIVGEKHTAYDDCVFQIGYAVAAMNKLRGFDAHK